MTRGAIEPNGVPTGAKTWPSISVVIPTCDRPSTLAACLERLAPGAQTLAPSRYEVIVTDDGGRNVARALVWERFPWAQWAEGPHRGPAANRNSGSRSATGDFLVFMDDDCLPEPDLLAAYARKMAEGAVALEGRIVSDKMALHAWDEAPVNLHGGYFWSANIGVRRDVFSSLGGFDENYDGAAMEDVDLRETLRSLGITIVFTPDATVCHPARRANVAVKWAHIKRLKAQVYFGRKWSGERPLRIYTNLMAAVLRFWLLAPIRRGWPGVRLATLYPLAAGYATLKFADWYREADRRIAGDR